MNREIESDWECDLDKRLKSLGELDAPSRLIPKIMGKIENRRSLNWYRQPYYTWSTLNKIKACLAFSFLSMLVTVSYYQGMHLDLSGWINAEIGQRVSSLSNGFDGLIRGLSVLGRTILMKYVLALSLLIIIVYGSVFSSGIFVVRILRQRMGVNNGS